MGQRLPLRPLRAAGPGWRCGPTSRRSAARDVQALRRLQAAHDAGRLRRLHGRPAKERRRARSAPRRRERVAGAAARGGRRSGMTALAAEGRRAPTKAANRAAILAAANGVFAEQGYEGAGVRDIIRRTELASGTFYNYFPDKESIFRALVEETGGEARRRVRAARARPVRGGVRLRWLPCVLRVHRRRSGDVRVHRRNPRRSAQEFGEAVLPAGTDELGRTCEPASRPGAAPARHRLLRPRDDRGRAGARHAARSAHPPDVEGATAFAAALFLGGMSRASQRSGA